VEPVSDALTLADPVLLYQRPAPPLGIALSGTDVCWVEGQTPRALFCAPAAGGGTPVRLDDPVDAAFLADAFDLALDANYVYWSSGASNQVVRKPLAGGAAAAYFDGDMRVSFLALDGTSVWATDYSSGTVQTGLGNVIVGPSAEGGLGSMLVYPVQSQAAGVAVFRGLVYWGRADGVAFGAKGGMPIPNRIASPGGGAVGGVAVDPAGGIAFVAGNQQVWWVVPGGTSPVLMYAASQPFGAGDVAADEAWIYWTEPDLGRIVRLPK
jgi:hypothetical protein